MSAPGLLLYIFVLVTMIGQGAYLASGEQPPGFPMAQTIGLLWILGWWLMRDSRRRGVTMVHDIGLFLYLAWPIVLTYYLLKTRGAKGLLFIAGFVCAYIGGLVLGIALYLLFGPAAGYL
ncbi:MAG: hypothetical protein QOD75_474 [Blastocatellia bacterium]|jgi:hypothetical protein|nr:hypothetical protein [Blastocatellia bacterium]